MEDMNHERESRAESTAGDRQSQEGKVLVIKGQKVLGVYDSELQAVEETVKTHPLGTFLVQKCEAGQESYTQTFHSRVAFALGVSQGAATTVQGFHDAVFGSLLCSPQYDSHCPRF
jgi:hypothetical protein